MLLVIAVYIDLILLSSVIQPGVAEPRDVPNQKNQAKPKIPVSKPFLPKVSTTRPKYWAVNKAKLAKGPQRIPKIPETSKDISRRLAEKQPDGGKSLETIEELEVTPNITGPQKKPLNLQSPVIQPGVAEPRDGGAYFNRSQNSQIRPKTVVSKNLRPKVSTTRPKYWVVNNTMVAKGSQGIPKILEDVSPRLSEEKPDSGKRQKSDKIEVKPKIPGPQKKPAAKSAVKRMPKTSTTLESKQNETKPALRREGNKRELKVNTVKMMEQAIYSTQDQSIEKVNKMVKKYEQDIKYRMAFIFLKLDQIKHEMHAMYIYMFKNHRAYNSKIKPPVYFRHLIIYYSHFVRKNIDITYAVEYLLELFQKENKEYK